MELFGNKIIRPVVGGENRMNILTKYKTAKK